MCQHLLSTGCFWSRIKPIFNQGVGPMLLLAAFVATSFPCAGAERPNIIVFLVDDIGYGDLEANNPECGIPTPNLNHLAKHGANFMNAHSSASVCAPTRYALLTGNRVYRGSNPMGTWPAFGGSQILPGQKTLADLLHSEGYTTAFFGKLHLGGVPSKNGPYGQFLQGPRDHGFDYSLTLPSGIQAKPRAFFRNDRLSRWDDRQKDFVHFDNATAADPHYQNQTMDNWSTETAGPLLMHDALDFIDRHHEEYQGNKPFYIHYCSQAGHTPYTPPAFFNIEDPMNTREGIPVRGQTTNLRTDMVYEADIAVGLFKERLLEHRLWDNTLLIFTSDNGVAKGLHSTWSKPIYHDSKDGLYGGRRTEKTQTPAGRDHINGQGVVDGIPIRGKKGYCYEGGHRVPLIFHWPDQIAPRDVESLFALHDVYRTVAGLLEVKVAPQQAMDSVDLSDLVISGDTSTYRQHLMIQANRPTKSQNKNLNSWSFYTTESEGGDLTIWKAIINNNRKSPQMPAMAEVAELYHLSTDPGETMPVSDDKRAEAMLQAYKESISNPK